ARPALGRLRLRAGRGTGARPGDGAVDRAGAGDGPLRGGGGRADGGRRGGRQPPQRDGRVRLRARPLDDRRQGGLQHEPRRGAGPLPGTVRTHHRARIKRVTTNNTNSTNEGRRKTILLPSFVLFVLFVVAL